MTGIAFWVVGEDWRVAEQSYRFMGRKNGIWLANEGALADALGPLVWAQAVGDFSNPFISADFPRPQLHMPVTGFAPDYFSIGLYKFVSQRLRDVFALPAGLVQYIPINLTDGGPEVRANNYRWMNLLACRPAIDLQRSIYKVRERTRHPTGETYWHIGAYERMVIRDDIAPSAELFRAAEDLVTVLASDFLAERVMRAVCTGISFEDPATARSLGPISRYRTATGVEEEDMDKVYPPAP